MAQAIKIETKGTKTYATRANALKAIEAYPNIVADESLRFFIHCDESTGRFFPVFVGQSAVQAGVHFRFHVVA